MNIALIGYGKMGKELEACARSRGHEVVLRLNSSSGAEAWKSLRESEVAIEFTRPEAAVGNILRCFEAGVPVVVGTTGWYGEKNRVEAELARWNGGLFYASNFSIGVNLFWKVNRQLAAMMNAHRDYRAEIKEIHHEQKLDAPSGTAITTANQIIEAHGAYRTWKLGAAGESEDGVLPIEALRQGEVKGTHVVSYHGPEDSIEIKHVAHSRRGFATGALWASEFMVNRTGLFGMEDLLAPKE